MLPRSSTIDNGSSSIDNSAMASIRNKLASRPPRYTVQDVCTAIESVAPMALAQQGDNVGLLAGDGTATVRRILLCIDLTEPVVDEAMAGKADFVLVYHPPIFKPILAMRRLGVGVEAAVFRCIREGMAVYAVHTALDVAQGGTNDTLAGLCGLTAVEPLEYVDRPGTKECKLVVFVPHDHVEKLSNALFGAGAGRIGDYSHCSFRIDGQGTFLGGESTSPTVGKRGRLEMVNETRLEVVFPQPARPAVIAALRAHHPYEEPAFDLYPQLPPFVPGMGRIGKLPRPQSVAHLARELKQATKSPCVQVIGPANQRVQRAIILAGSAGSLPFRALQGLGDVVITGEIRHHDALAILRHRAVAIALGHWSSERPVLLHLASRLRSGLSSIDVRISKNDREPFRLI